MYRVRSLSPTMPAMPRDMSSWLSPKRRRTTGNLRGMNGTVTTNGSGDAMTTVNGAGSDMSTSPPQPSIPESPTSPTPGQRRPKAVRPASQPVVRRMASSAGSSTGLGEDSGNLFYAYARKVCNPRNGWRRDTNSQGRAMT